MPVGKQATFHIMIISEATQHGLENDYLNVITASLNFEVNENIYMALPKGVSEATYNTIDNGTRQSMLSSHLNSSNQKLIPIYLYT